MKDQHDIFELIQKGESETLELKSSFNNEVIETLVAFANTNGGKCNHTSQSRNKLIATALRKLVSLNGMDPEFSEYSQYVMNMVE